MTVCTICGGQCFGNEDTSNPFCVECQVLSFGGSEHALYELLRDRQSQAWEMRRVAREAHTASLHRSP